MASIRMRGRIHKIFIGRINSNLENEIRGNQLRHLEYLKSLFPKEEDIQDTLSDCNLIISSEPCTYKNYVDVYAYFDLKYLFTQLSKNQLGILLYKFQRYLNGLETIVEATQNTGMSTDATTHVKLDPKEDIEKKILKVKNVLQGKKYNQ